MKNAYQNNKELIQRLTPALSYSGKDFEVWKGEARAKLSSLLGMDKFQRTEPELNIEYDKNTDGFREIRFTFESERGYRVPCHLLLPLGKEKPPVIICLQGHSTVMHISLARPIYERDI